MRQPEAWIFSIAAVGTFLPVDVSRLTGVFLTTGILMVVVVGSSSIWAAGGAALDRIVESEHGPARGFGRVDLGRGRAPSDRRGIVVPGSSGGG